MPCSAISAVNPYPTGHHPPRSSSRSRSRPAPTAHRRFINHTAPLAASNSDLTGPSTFVSACPPPTPRARTGRENRMGNCQAAEAATVVVQHPGGRVERLYWATSAAEVMRANPGHYVALVTHRADAAGGKPPHPQEQRGAARVTRVKLLKPRDTLALGQAYRLITFAEVTKALQAKKEEKTRRAQQQQLVLLQPKHAGGRVTAAGEDSQLPPQLVDGSLDQQDRDGHRSNPSSAAHSGARHRHWRPSLHSIAEVSS
ncbi:uncharacterized protein [Setaria viridis]|uniref:DUF4228 domain-containing protein n=1 Tax=Setaria viridis TaxID=4556 RepID=A0A4U6UZ29_SETVI|nr:hypothetical protein SEVIR_4G104200v2 [Setaria viridis]